MLNYIWPVALVILSNTLYHICAKNSPQSVNPFATLIVTYLVGAVFATLVYFFTEKDHNIIRDITSMNWSPYALGLVIVGLEVGNIYTYRAGWQVSMASIVQNAFLAIVLVFVGYGLFKEAITINKVVGILMCLIGLVIINR